MTKEKLKDLIQQVMEIKKKDKEWFKRRSEIEVEEQGVDVSAQKLDALTILEELEKEEFILCGRSGKGETLGSVVFDSNPTLSIDGDDLRKLVENSIESLLGIPGDFLIRVKDVKDSTYFQEITKKAEDGDPEAQFSLGYYYENGNSSIGLKKDKEKSFYWYKKAADQNYLQAYMSIAAYYKEGVGVERDEKQAQEWADKFNNSQSLYTFDIGL